MARTRKGISISQRKYVLDLLKETGMMGCKPVETPMYSAVKLGIKGDSAPVDKGRHQRLVGKLIYLSHTRPDIGFSVSVVSQFMKSPTEEHMETSWKVDLFDRDLTKHYICRRCCQSVYACPTTTPLGSSLSYSPLKKHPIKVYFIKLQSL